MIRQRPRDEPLASSQAAGADADGASEWPLVHSLQPQAEAVVALAWDPLQQFLALASAEGVVRVLDAGRAFAVAATLQGAKSAAAAESAGVSSLAVEFPLCWHPTGATLAYAVDAGVAVARRASWDRLYVLAPPGVAAAAGGGGGGGGAGGPNAACWSPNGRYLASADARRILSVWDVTAAEPTSAMRGYVSEHMDEGNIGGLAPQSATPAAISSLGWAGDGLAIVFVDTDGTVGAVKTAYLFRRDVHAFSATEPVEENLGP